MKRVQKFWDKYHAHVDLSDWNLDDDNGVELFKACTKRAAGEALGFAIESDESYFMFFLDEEDEDGSTVYFRIALGGGDIEQPCYSFSLIESLREDISLHIDDDLGRLGTSEIERCKKIKLALLEMVSMLDEQIGHQQD